MFFISLLVIKKIQVFVTHVNCGLILNAITSIMLIISIYQPVMIPSIVLIVVSVLFK